MVALIVFIAGVAAIYAFVSVWFFYHEVYGENTSAGRSAITPQWQEISTAPRDGSRIMLWDSRDGGSPTFGSWRVGSEDEHGTITHWLPLPAPPEGE